MNKTATTFATELIPKEEAETRADVAYKKLCALWIENLQKASEGTHNFVWNDFWKAGNTLDCIIGYFAVRKPTAIPPEHSISTVIRLALDLFGKKHYPSSDPYHWRDDYGWWGNALANAYKYRKELGIDPALANECKVAAIEYGWKPLDSSANANKIFEPRCTKFRGFGEGFAVWNDGSAHDYDWDTNACRIKPEDNYQPTPNTVTNVAFMALSSVIYEHLDVTEERQKYLDCLRGSYGWFDYFSAANQLLNNVGLVRETVNPDVHKKWCIDNVGDGTGVRNRAWSADQGAFLYSLLNTLRRETNSSTADKIKAIIGSMATGFVNGTNQMIGSDGALREFPFDPKSPRPKDGNLVNFNCNYSTGPGVFMRYVGYIMADVKLRDEIAKISPKLESTLSSLIQKSSQGAWDNRDTVTNQFTLWYQSYSDTEKNPYEYWYDKDPTYAPKQLWDVAFQTAALDVFVAYLRLYPQQA